MKKFLVVVLAIVFALSFAACKKETEAPMGQQGLPQGHPQTGGGDMGQISVPQERQIVVPDEVKGAWKGIALNIENKESSKMEVMNIALGAEQAIAGSNITVKADAFLPDFIMEGPVITSRSAELNNPAAKITVMEGGEEIFNSWIYANHPAIHPFMHEKFGITLKEGTK